MVQLVLPRYLLRVFKKYSLDVLRHVRAALVEKKARDVAGAMQLASDAQVLAEARRRDADEFEKRCREIEQEECRRLEDGKVSAGELACAASWAMGRERECAAYMQDLTRAEARLSDTCALVARERRLLADARAEADLVERHRDRWEQRQLLERASAEDEEASENHQNLYCARGEK